MTEKNNESVNAVETPVTSPENATETNPPCINYILDQINKSNNNQQQPEHKESLAPTKLPASKKTKLKKLEEVPRGKPKSGRPWKSVKQKFSNIKKSMYRRSFEKKMELRNEIKHIKELSHTIKEERKKENEMKKQKRLENAAKRLENERKAEVVQIIKNPAKLKRMRKKQLRMIEKRDLDKVKVV